jgi:hypothetical protein
MKLKLPENSLTLEQLQLRAFRKMYRVVDDFHHHRVMVKTGGLGEEDGN